MKTLVLFDFDHTLYKGDSMLDFAKRISGKKRFYTVMFTLLPSLAGLKLGILDNQKVKEKFLAQFIRGMKVKDFENLARGFSFSVDLNLEKKLRIKFLDHLSNEDEVAIVTASLPQWILGWSEGFGVKVIGSVAESVAGVMTGNLVGKNCYGPEKVNRIREVYDLDDFDRIIVYGNGKGDREMRLLARG